MIYSYILPILVVLAVAAGCFAMKYCHRLPVIRFMAVVVLLLGSLYLIAMPVEFFCFCRVWHHLANMVLTFLVVWLVYKVAVVGFALYLLRGLFWGKGSNIR